MDHQTHHAIKTQAPGPCLIDPFVVLVIATDTTFAQFTSNCMGNANMSIVAITVVDSSFSFGDSAPLPECCGDNEILGEICTHLGVNIKAAQCTCVLDCCVEDTKCV
jgi:hypothetical protein